MLFRSLHIFRIGIISLNEDELQKLIKRAVELHKRGPNFSLPQIMRAAQFDLSQSKDCALQMDVRHASNKTTINYWSNKLLIFIIDIVGIDGLALKIINFQKRTAMKKNKMMMMWRPKLLGIRKWNLDVMERDDNTGGK